MGEKYNGWSNYETWATKLWLDNDEGTYSYWQERTREIVREIRENPQKARVWTREEETRFTLEDAVKEWVREYAPEVDGLYSDLLQSSLDNVDYLEIAEAMLDDFAEDWKEEDAEEDEGEED